MCLIAQETSMLRNPELWQILGNLDPGPEPILTRVFCAKDFEDKRLVLTGERVTTYHPSAILGTVLTTCFLHKLSVCCQSVMQSTKCQILFLFMTSLLFWSSHNTLGSVFFSFMISTFQCLIPPFSQSQKMYYFAGEDVGKLNNYITSFLATEWFILRTL